MLCYNVIRDDLKPYQWVNGGSFWLCLASIVLHVNSDNHPEPDMEPDRTTGPLALGFEVAL